MQLKGEQAFQASPDSDRMTSSSKPPTSAEGMLGWCVYA